jgi:hypothetical protein
MDADDQQDLRTVREIAGSVPTEHGLPGRSQRRSGRRRRPRRAVPLKRSGPYEIAGYVVWRPSAEGVCSRPSALRRGPLPLMAISGQSRQRSRMSALDLVGEGRTHERGPSPFYRLHNWNVPSAFRGTANNGTEGTGPTGAEAAFYLPLRRSALAIRQIADAVGCVSSEPDMAQIVDAQAKASEASGGTAA